MTDLAGRVSMTPREVHEMTGAPMALIRTLIADGSLRSRRVGRRVFVDPASVTETFGFEPKQLAATDTPRVRYMAERILSDSR